ncbi:MAG: heat-inducible transcriptional repressor HrcA [Actinomycetota bacterium]
MLDQRKAEILRAIVREYVRTGQPVASGTLAARHGLNVSPATVRNEMARLEELGYVSQPHTSAGRSPTDLGYRWFIDAWPGAQWPSLPEPERQVIAGTFESNFGDLEEALDATSQVLSQVTEAMALVAAPSPGRLLLRRLELLRRDDYRATLLLIADGGHVEQGVVDFSAPRSAEQLARLAKELSSELDGTPLEAVADTIRSSRRPGGDRGRVAEEGQRILRKHAAERVFRGGTASIFSTGNPFDHETAHVVVGVLERPTLLSRLLESARGAASVLVFVGRENPIREMHGCGVVFAPYAAGSDRRGTLGVIGPTRMDYPHTISAVEEVARSLSGLLSAVGA